MKYAIIGGGISGLSIANLLKDEHEVTVFEADTRPGGMIKCDVLKEGLFHRTGGHVFNTKREDVAKWFWSFFEQEKQFVKTQRNSVVFMPDGQEIPYPIENHAYLLRREIGKEIVGDLLMMANEKELKNPSNFEEFLRGRFGQTLYKLYFQPYNQKIWRRDLTKVPLSWLEGKLPMPTVEEIIYNNIYHIKEESFVHSSFYYPLKGGSQFIADRFAKGLNIRYATPINKIGKNKLGGFVIEGETFDRLVFCGNIKQLPRLLSGIVDLSGFVSCIEQLEFHGTTSVFCEINMNPYSWIYLPNRECESHRIICTGNFAASNNGQSKMTGTVEFTDHISKEQIMHNLSAMPLSPRYITHHYEQTTYPIQDKNTREMILKLKEKLSMSGLYLCGRFAEWEYANMDVCIGSAMDLRKNDLR